ncbi:large ribosomal subunit protein mL65 [Prorops nasuta]|uniref:large ribosomal subunit protein mL65 n=1 Tax=Prorops nasuta TaxID=863751 RepID=UPI0034CF151F
MLGKVRQRMLNHHLLFSNMSKKFSHSIKSEATIYPPILDLSYEATQRRKREAWHDEIRRIKTVEEKLFKINMPRYYGWKSVILQEEKIPYNALPLTQYITRTHVMERKELPNYYDQLIENEQLDFISSAIQNHIMDIIAFEYTIREREYEQFHGYFDDKSVVENKVTNRIVNQINKTLLANLSSIYPHLMEIETDIEPRIEAFWFAGGLGPPNSRRKSLEGIKFFKKFANDPIDRPIQYLGSPSLQLRCQYPLKEFIPVSDIENCELHIPCCNFDPSVFGICSKRRHGTTIPGFWPGDPCEFAFLSYHKLGHLHNRPAYKDLDDIITVQSIRAAYAWLYGQACYQGFCTYQDLTYPLTTQLVLTNGQFWALSAYQLNTILHYEENADHNSKRNLCWTTAPMQLFAAVENEKVIGFNIDVLKQLIKFYINVPQEKVGVNMKPYLDDNVQVIADIEDTGRREWLESNYKHLVSNRPRHRRLPHIYLWQKVYMIDNKARSMDKKRDWWQLGHPGYKRRLDDHTPKYIPRKHRENPKKRKIGRWAKTYYP